ncbi:MAG: hypothetical protein IJ489_10230 [Clostridia bacterium]|nr:hypothetical protein [Clostridia bacterium]
MPRDVFGLGETICPVCGKTFCPRGAWGYHGKKGRRVCSYPCSLKDQADKEESGNSNRLAVDMYDMSGNLISSFRSVHDAFLHTGINQAKIRACATGRTKYTRRNGETVVFRYKKQED